MLPTVAPWRELLAGFMLSLADTVRSWALSLLNVPREESISGSDTAGPHDVSIV